MGANSSNAQPSLCCGTGENNTPKRTIRLVRAQSYLPSLEDARDCLSPRNGVRPNTPRNSFSPYTSAQILSPRACGDSQNLSRQDERKILFRSIDCASTTFEASGFSLVYRDMLRMQPTALSVAPDIESRQLPAQHPQSGDEITACDEPSARRRLSSTHLAASYPR